MDPRERGIREESDRKFTGGWSPPVCIRDIIERANEAGDRVTRDLQPGMTVKHPD
jgi:hypothetical protein